ncbi:MAG: hypothetical protein FWH26_06430 [Oscillospiraceae bacterium]|nr:hypothetical protein [Oscillospiraceae bacterium]
MTHRRRALLAQPASGKNICVYDAACGLHPHDVPPWFTHNGQRSGGIVSYGGEPALYIEHANTPMRLHFLLPYVTDGDSVMEVDFTTNSVANQDLFFVNLMLAGPEYTAFFGLYVARNSEVRYVYDNGAGGLTQVTSTPYTKLQRLLCRLERRDGAAAVYINEDFVRNVPLTPTANLGSYAHLSHLPHGSASGMWAHHDTGTTWTWIYSMRYEEL